MPFDVTCIYDVYYRLRPFVKHEIARNYLFLGVSGQGIDARKVGHHSPRTISHLAVLSVYGDSREIAHVLIGAGQLVEKSGLSAVLLPD